MESLLGLLATIVNLATVVVGFGLIVTVHELGHFIAARWAGIRVLAFGIGFGPPVLSYRRGIGWRRGTSEAEYRSRLASGDAAGLSPTEYRLAPLPLGGYVKMLGQDDLDPGAVSSAPDSYQSAPVWKRMVVISAGVLMNLVSAAALFIAVFMLGLRTEPPKVGGIDPDGPAARATADGVDTPGLRPGDTIVGIDGEAPRSFNDVVMAAALAKRDRVMKIDVQRPGHQGTLTFAVTPDTDEVSGLLGLGFGPAQTTTLPTPKRSSEAEELARALRGCGLDGVPAGATLVRAAGAAVQSAADLDAVFAASSGRAVDVVFLTAEGASLARTLTPQAEPQVGWLTLGAAPTPVEHVLGLMPVLMVDAMKQAEQGLEPGDVFIRIGAVEYPGITEGIAEVRRHRGKTVEVEVLRRGPDGVDRVVTLTPMVKPIGGGRIGFTPATTWDVSNVVAAVPDAIGLTRRGERTVPAARGVVTRAGTRVVAVNGVETATLAEVRTALREAALAAGGPVTVTLTLAAPTLAGPADAAALETVTWDLDAGSVATLTGLGWASPVPAGLFDLEQTLLKAGSPVEAVAIGLHETRRILASVYVQLGRLFEGTVKIEHLKGPVGIAHVGTLLAERGPVWLMFFLALISVNLAVVNFLPLPIVDGGQFLMLAYEGLRGRPVPLSVQNLVTTAGLVMIVSVFLVVTFNDVRALLGL